MTAHYYNENDPFCAQWLRNLIGANLIPAGDVDERSIVDVQPEDIRRYVQCHFFCGLAGWPAALHLAGWPSDRPMWSGSCPCQPYSNAGKGKGAADERHLWPAWFRLIEACMPDRIVGEQVASAAVIGRLQSKKRSVDAKTGTRSEGQVSESWLDLISANLETAHYAFGSIVVPAAGGGAPHERHRLFWCAERLADAGRGSDERFRQPRSAAVPAAIRLADARGGGRRDCGHVKQATGDRESDGSGDAGGLADARGGGWQRDGRRASAIEGGPSYASRLGLTISDRRQQGWPSSEAAGQRGTAFTASRGSERMGDTVERGLPHPAAPLTRGEGRIPCGTAAGSANGPLDPWRELEWIACRDGKSRPVGASLFPLAYGHSGRVAVSRSGGQPGRDTAPSQESDVRWVNRVGTLRAAGNAIVVPLAAEFLKAWLDLAP